jgi:acyl carrier protein
MIESLAPAEQFPAVRLVHLSGAPVYQSDFEGYQEHFPPDSLFLHRIGATETQTISWRLMDRSTAISPGPLPLGWAPQGKELLILDDKGESVPFGETGEIALKSRFIAPGYWQLPELSHEKFRLDLHSGERTYLTGDLGRMTAECGLIHLGRKDFQIKIRGYRVEPEQVERALMEHPGVKDAVVLGMTSPSGSEKLVGYYTTAESPPQKVESLRNYLKEKLPDYMIPSAFIQLAALPLNPNGKIDRHALPAPPNLRPDLGSAYVEPSSALEQQLAGIWQDVLELECVGIHDNFYDLGGDSLAATKIVAQIVKQLRLELALRSLFQAPTVAEMAAVITAHRGGALGGESLERKLSELESLSEEEAQRRLAAKRSTTVDK